MLSKRADISVRGVHYMWAIIFDALQGLMLVALTR